MKIKTILSGCITGILFTILFPLTTILINNHLNLPVYNELIYRITGFTICTSGITIFLYCSYMFIKIGGGTPAPIEPPKELVIKGIYRFTRNPIYIGYFLILLGEFFIFGYLLLLFYFIAMLVFMQIYVVYIEEPKLKKRFGEAYKDYMKNVPRWLKI